MTIKEPYKPAVCADGFAVSIQGSEHHYCEPREDYPSEYASVELGFPAGGEYSITHELIGDYAEDPSEPGNTVYPGVPVEVVNELIEKHGGLTSTTPLPPGVTQPDAR
tara:strand:- start:168 stop:491 length:324 start_codon:yes stop_codon:yes gene_type:complete